MKRKMRTILLTTWKSSQTTIWIFCLIVFLATLLLATSLFFAGGDTVEKSIASSMPLELHYTNDNSFSNGSAGDELMNADAEIYADTMETYLNDLDQLTADSSLSYANYNITAFLPVDENGAEMMLCGISTKDFLKQHSVNLSEGSLDDFDENSIILPDYMKNSYTPGNMFTVYLPDNNGYTKTELKIAGFYTQTYQYNTDDDSFDNSAAPLLYNNTLRRYLSKSRILYGQTLNAPDPMDSLNADSYKNEDGTIDEEALSSAVNAYYDAWNKEHPFANQPRALVSNITFKMNDLDGYNAFLEKFNAFSMEENRKMAQVEYTSGGTARSFSLGLKASVNHFGAFLSVIGRVKLLYQFIFTAIWILAVLSLFQFLRYMQNKREKELFIRRSMGETKHHIVKFWISYYLWPAIPSVIIGCIPGYVFSWLLSRYIGQGSDQMQQEMAQLTGSAMNDYQKIGLFDLSGRRFVINMLMILLISLSAVIVCAAAATRSTMHGKLSRHARGEMRYE